MPEWQLQSSSHSEVYVSSPAEETPEASAKAAETVVYSWAESVDSLTEGWQLVMIIVFILGVIVTAGVLLVQKIRYSRRLKNSLLVERNQTINNIMRDMSMGPVAFACFSCDWIFKNPLSMISYTEAMESQQGERATAHRRKGRTGPQRCCTALFVVPVYGC